MQKVLLLFSLMPMLFTYIAPGFSMSFTGESANKSTLFMPVEPMQIIANDVNTCQGSTTNLELIVAGGIAPYTYDWTGPNTFVSTATAPQISAVNTADVGTYKVVVTDNTGEKDSTEIELTIATDYTNELAINGTTIAPKYIIDFDAAPPTFNWIDSNKVEVVGDVLLRSDTITDAGFDYIITMDVSGGPSGATPINFPSDALTSASKFQKDATTINTSGGKKAIVYAIDGRTGEDPIIYHRDPSTKMTFSMKLDSGKDFLNTTYEVGDMDYNFESSLPDNTCFDQGEPNDYRCRYSYIDRITFLSGITTNEYSFPDATKIHSENSVQFYSQFTDTNGNNLPDLSDDGRVDSDNAGGNITVYNPNNIGDEIKFIYDDPGMGLETDADGYHDFDSRNQVMSFLTGMTFDVLETTTACTDTISISCKDQIVLSADASLGDVVWFNEANDIVGTGAMLTIDSSTIQGADAFYYIGTNPVGCQVQLACAVPVVMCCSTFDLSEQNQVIVSNTAADTLRATISTLQGIGDLNYQWQSSNLSCAGPFQNIVGATDIAYAPDTSTQSTYYRLVLTEMLVGDTICQAISTCISIETRTINLGGCIIDDLDRDGLSNDGTAPISDVTISLFNALDSINAIADTLTDEDGQFVFDELPAGKYYIAYELPAGYIFPSGVLKDRTGYTNIICLEEDIIENCISMGRCAPINIATVDTIIVPGDTVCLSSLADYNWSPTTGVSITCDTCQEVCLSPDSTSTYTVTWSNQGVYDCPHETTVNVTVLSELGGCVREDVNRDSMMNEGDTILSNIVVQLFELGDTLQAIDSTLTDTQGKYLFDSLPAGKYLVRFSPLLEYEFAPGFEVIGDMIIREGYSDIICLASGDSDIIYDALLVKCENTSLSIEEAKLFSGDEICVTVSGAGAYEWIPALPDYTNCDTCTVFKITVDTSINYTISSKATTCTDDEATLKITTAYIGTTNECTCLGNKRLEDDIHVYSIYPNETWRYAGGTGLLNAKRPPEDLAIGTAMAYTGSTPDGYYVYTLSGIHLDGMGYTAQFSNGTHTMDISNQCNQDVSCPQLSTIEGCVLEDMDRDGIKNDSDEAMENVWVRLFTCEDKENEITSMLTQADGTYSFSELLPDNYIIKVDIPSNYLFSSKSELDADGFSACIPLGAATTISNCNTLFGACYLIDFVAADTTILAGEQICIKMDNRGGYEWTPTAGIACMECEEVCFTPKTTTTYTLAWNNPAAYSCDFSRAFTINVVRNIGGCVQEDVDGDGNASDDNTPMPNITVNLFQEGNLTNVIANQVTDPSGNYLFENLEEGNYIVQFIAPTDYLFPLAASPYGNLAANNGMTNVIVLDAGSEQLEICTHLYTCAGIDLSQADQAISPGESAQFSFDEPGSYLWTPATGLDCTTCPSVTASPNETTTYTVQLSNPEDGCDVETEIVVEVQNPFVVTDNSCICDGTYIFKETVSIYSYSANETWTLTSNNGFYRPIYNPLKAYELGTNLTYKGLNTEGFHEYTIDGQHFDGLGYTLNFTNGNQRISTNLSITSSCSSKVVCPVVTSTPLPTVPPETEEEPPSDIDPEATPVFPTDVDPTATPGFPGNFDPTATPGFPGTESDCEKPSVYAIHGLAIDLMEMGMIEIAATDFAHKSLEGCLDAGKLYARIWHPSLSYTAPLQLNAIFDLPETIIFTCDHLGIQDVDLYIIGENLEWNVVKTYIDIQDNLHACEAIESGDMAMVSGRIADWNDNTIENVNVTSTHLSEIEMGQMDTEEDGKYDFSLPMHTDYSITPTKITNPLNGVSTFDLVLITKHILGIQTFENPYQWIAADINDSGTVSAFDLVQLRKMILSIDKNFPNNNSWRFIDASYTFESNNPFGEEFPETGIINGLHTDMQMDFVAVKIGDINGNAQVNGFQETSSRNSSEVFEITTEDQYLNAGDRYEVSFHTNQLREIQGYQFTLSYNDLSIEKLESGVMVQENFGLHKLKEGLLTASWNTATPNTASHLFTLQLKANRDGYLSEFLQLGNSPTLTEAYNMEGNTLDMAVKFKPTPSASFDLYQNEPNPFQGQTSIGFYLPEASEVALIIRDESGRILQKVQTFKSAGLHQITVDNLGHTKGFLHYQLITNFGTKSKKMLIHN